MAYLTLDINGDLFRNKVYGCWLGKNCGGTLGAPLEKAYGEPEPFDVWWYPRLEEGGIPNDDLEMQLIWLKALEEVGPGLRASDLAQYWLDHIGYNWDEYGLSKTNLRLGLLPPVSGYYNNWFRDCMGCPIRSEIWACIAPGVPALAVRYAYEDAICDHAGGESVFGEMFNAAIEAAAFVVADRDQLLDIGLSYVPPTSATARAVNAARAAHAAGEDWKAARRRVLAATPNYNAQYSPINMGFQVIGWLYGEEFGDAICKAVNCGYDTDCTGATLGSILGIIDGRGALPAKWTAPLGEEIATNASWGGLRNLAGAVNPIPRNLGELTERVARQAARILTAHGILPGNTTTLYIDPQSLYANEEIKVLWNANPLRIDYTAANVQVSIEYKDQPVILPGQETGILTHLTNPHPDRFTARCELLFPTHWGTPPLQQSVELPAQESIAVAWRIPPLPERMIENTQQLLLSVTVEGRPAQPAVPIVLIGANRYRYSSLYPTADRPARELFDSELEPERVAGSVTTPHGRPGTWHDLYASDNALPLQDVFNHAGVLYVQTFLFSPAEQDVWLGVPATSPVKAWVNQEPLIQYFAVDPIRPNYGGYGTEDQPYARVRLRQGWNELLLKYVRAADNAPFEAHLVLSEPDQLHSGITTIGRTRTPWEG